jgi:hypothetical protein
VFEKSIRKAYSGSVFVEQPGKRINRTVETKLGMQRIGLEPILPAGHLWVAEMVSGAEQDSGRP